MGRTTAAVKQRLTKGGGRRPVGQTEVPYLRTVLTERPDFVPTSGVVTKGWLHLNGYSRITGHRWGYSGHMPSIDPTPAARVQTAATRDVARRAAGLFSGPISV